MPRSTSLKLRVARNPPLPKQCGHVENFTMNTPLALSLVNKVFKSASQPVISQPVHAVIT